MKKWFILLMAASIAGLISWNIYAHLSKPRIGYIQLTEVYNGFEYKKELEAKLTQVQNGRQNMLDSLELQLKALSNNLAGRDKVSPEDAQDFEVRKQDYLAKQQQFEEDNQATTDQYLSQISKQMNQYVQDFGIEHGYQYILGGDGTGVLMYAEKGNDITADVIKYINDRYKGGIK